VSISRTFGASIVLEDASQNHSVAVEAHLAGEGCRIRLVLSAIRCAQSQPADLDLRISTCGSRPDRAAMMVSQEDHVPEKVLTSLDMLAAKRPVLSFTQKID
jgi:hypothetical protein